MRRILAVALASALVAISESPAGSPEVPPAPAAFAPAGAAEGMKAVKRQDKVTLTDGTTQFGTIIARGERAILLFSESQQKTIEIEAAKVRSIEEGVPQGFLDLPAGASAGEPAAAPPPAAPPEAAKPWKDQRAEIEKKRIDGVKKGADAAKKKADEAKQKADEAKKKAADEAKKKADDDAKKRADRSGRKKKIGDRIDQERERILRESIDKAKQNAEKRQKDWQRDLEKQRGDNPLIPDVGIPEGVF